MKKNELVTILFIIYSFLLVWIILFKLSISINDFNHFRSVNLLPFYYANEVNFHFKEVVANILIFIPFGIYLKILDIKEICIVILGFCFSIILELLQYIFMLGATDITDIITNTFGVLIGVVFYEILLKIFRNYVKINKVLQILGLIITIVFILFISLILLVNN